EVGGTGGHWPHHIVLRDVTVADREGVWLRLEELSLRWNPLALIGGRVSIDDLSVPRGTLARLPESPEKEPEAPGLPSLPKLPDLTIGSLTVGALDVKAAAAGHDTVLHVKGATDMRSDSLRLSLQAATEGERADKADIAIDWAPAQDRLSADVQITGPENSLLTRLLGIGEGSLSVSAGGAGPASDWTGSIEAQAGALGSLSGKLACACLVPPKLRLDVMADPGPALPESTRRYLGESARLTAALYSGEASTLTLEVTALDISAARLVRPLRISLTEVGRLLRFDVSAGLAPGPALDGETPPWLGEAFRISARGGFPREGGIRIAEAYIAGKDARLSLESARLAPDGALEGTGILNVTSTAALPESVAEVAGTEARLTFGLAGVWGETLRLEDLLLETASGTGAEGRLAYDLERAALETDLDLTLPAPVFAALTGLSEPSQAVTGKLTAEGPLESLSARLAAMTPELELDARKLPPARTVLTLGGGLDDPEGKLTVRRLDAEEEPVLLSADLAWPGLETLHVSNLKAELDGTTLDGEAQIATKTGRITGNAKLGVPDLAALTPQASGSLKADISLKREAQGELRLSATAETPELSYGDIEAEDVKASASGPLGTLSVTAAAKQIDTPDAGIVRDFDLAAEADLTDGVKADIGKLEAIVDGTALALRSPVQVAVTEETADISEARFSWGEEGSLTAQAALTPEALKANLEMTKASVPGEPVLITGSVRLDTQAEQKPGTLDLRLEPRDGPEAAVEIAGAWNGKRIDLTGNLKGSGKKTGQVTGEILKASIPLTLERSNGAFSVGTGGPLEATLKYKGKLNPLTAIFLAKPERELAGTLDADIRMSGTLTAPQVKGAVVLSEGRYENTGAGVTLSAIDARLEFAGGAEGGSGTLTLTAWDGRKSRGKRVPVTGEGRFTVNRDGLQVDADMRLRDATLVRRRDLTATLSGDAGLSGTLPELEFAGDMQIDRMDLLIPEGKAEGVQDVPVILVNEQGEPLDPEEKRKEAAGGGGLVVALDLKVRSDGQAFVRGRGVDSEWKADLSVGGTIEEPKVNGSLTLKKGNISFAGRRFTLSEGEVNFTGQTPPDPVLNIVAEYETEDEETKALVRVSGRTSEPAINLDSQPPLPREQIMALVLFGKPVKELTALQALQVTQSLAQLTGTGPFGGGSIMDRARRTLGLDLLDLTFGKENGDVGLTIGRYVSEGIFVSATQDTSGEGGKVSVEVELTDEFSIETDIGQDASGSVSAQWKKDY
ncbi:MAG: translocation/assembly module TamB domain-containing protein, partial [Alphaproteobacteria bacterium]